MSKKLSNRKIWSDRRFEFVTYKQILYFKFYTQSIQHKPILFNILSFYLLSLYIIAFLSNFHLLAFICSPLFMAFHIYRVRTSRLPLGSLKDRAWCLSFSRCRVQRYMLLLFVMTLQQEEMKEIVQILEREFSRTRNI